MASDKTDNNMQHIIQVPLYTIPLWEEGSDCLFPTNYEDIISLLKGRLEAFSPKELRNGRKEKKTTIEKIYFSEKKIAQVPCILVRCTVSDSNLGDSTLEDDTIIKLSTKAKMKFENYYFLLYPKIDGPVSNRLSSVLMLVYDDPYHDSSTSCRISTTIIKKVLNLSPRNIKLDSVIQEVAQASVIPELRITLLSMDNTASAYAPKISQYQTNASKFERQILEYQGIPKDKVTELLKDDDCGDYNVKEITVSIGKKQLKVKRDVSRGIGNMKTYIESLFNSTISITDDEMSRLYDEDFIIEKLHPVLNNFISNGTIHN